MEKVFELNLNLGVGYDIPQALPNKLAATFKLLFTFLVKLLSLHAPLLLLNSLILRCLFKISQDINMLHYLIWIVLKLLKSYLFLFPNRR